jgi:hypothetical protein
MLAYARTDTRFLIPLCARLLHLLCDEVLEDNLCEEIDEQKKDELRYLNQTNASNMDDDDESDQEPSWHDVPSPPPPPFLNPQDNNAVGMLGQGVDEIPDLVLPVPRSLRALTAASPGMQGRYRRLLVDDGVLRVIVSAMRNSTCLWSPGVLPNPLSEILSYSYGSLPSSPVRRRPRSNLYKKIDVFKRFKKSRKWTEEHSHVLMR